jgi:hypothetical protein
MGRASLSKPLTAAAVSKLVEGEKLRRSSDVVIVVLWVKRHPESLGNLCAADSDSFERTSMRRLSILSLLLLIVLFALVFALFARLHEEAFFCVTGPLLGAMLAALAYRRDPWALISGGVGGGVCQGIIAVLVLKRGYVFPEVAMITAAHFLANLAAHLTAGLVIGTLLYLAFRWARPPSPTSDPACD